MHRKHVLLLSPTFPPDVGGVETHMDDLLQAFQKHAEFRVTVSTHKPIVTKGVKSYQKREEIGNVTIFRHWWFGGLFHILEHYPFLQFLYLVPYLFVRTLFLCWLKVGKPDVIYAHGLSSALIGKWLKKIFGSRLVVATHAVYEMNPSSRVAGFTRWILKSADKVLCLSDASVRELKKIGLEEDKLGRFRNWIQFHRFPLIEKQEAKKVKGGEGKFVVLFVGRMLKKKGIELLHEVARECVSDPLMEFWFVGVGPDEDCIKQSSLPNVKFWGKVDNKELYWFYAAADVFCIPSLYEEGFGRVILEALACGTPVIGSNRGGILEVVTSEVGVVVEPTEENLLQAIKLLRNDTSLYKRMQENTRAYVEKFYSEKNFEEIVLHFEERSQ